MAVDNQMLIAKSLGKNTNQYLQGIPQAEQATLKQTADYICDPHNRANVWNPLINTLINRIGETFIESRTWSNPLAEFKRSSMLYGSILQQILPGWARGHSYVDNAEDLFKITRPEAQAFYHEVNFQETYEMTIVEPELRQAFYDQYGLDRMISGLMENLENRVEHDQYSVMKQLFKIREDLWGGYFKVNLSAAPTTEATARELLVKIREYAEKITYPSTLYSASCVDIPTFAKKDEMVLFVDPSTKAVIDVLGLAPLFHLDKADVPITIKVLDEFPTTTTYAILTTKDFFVCCDTIDGMFSLPNPKTMGETFFRQVQGIYSVNPAVPAIVFTTGAGTSVPETTFTATAWNLTADDDEVAPGGTRQLTGTLNATISGGDTEAFSVVPNSGTYTITCTRTIITPGEDEGDDPTSTTISVPLNRRTWVDKFGVLHVQKTGLLEDDVLHVVGTSVYMNPSGTTTQYTDDVDITII